jgi:hypothetical protein
LRCCGFSCKSNNYGQFLFILGSGVSGGRSASDHKVSEVTVLACGNQNYGDGTLCIESPVSAAFSDVNVTACIVYGEGAALYAQSGDEIYTATYLHVESCRNADSVVANSRSGYPTIDHANFYNNAPNYDVLYGNDRGMNLRYCVFSGNSGTLINTQSQKFDIDFCYFSGDAPSSSEASIGPNCVTNCVTESYGVFAMNSADCPEVPRATRSRSMSAPFNPSPYFNASPHFIAVTHLNASPDFNASTDFNASPHFSASPLHR